MAVTFDAVGPTSSGTGGATSPLTWTHVNGGNGILVGATIFNGSTNTITAVTYGGVSLALQGFIPGDNDGAGGIALYGLVGATCPTGSNTVSVSFSDGANHNAGSISVAGAGSLGTPVTGFANATSVSVSVANTTTGGLIVTTASFGGTQLNTFSGTNGVTVQWQHPGSGNSGSDNGVGGTVASTGGGASQSVGFSDTGTDFWGIVAVEVLPAATAAVNAPAPFQLNPPGRQSPMAFQYVTTMPVSYDVAAPAAAAGTVQPLPTRQPRRNAARAYWRGYTSATTNLRNGRQPGGVVYRRRPAGAVWRGFVSSTTNLRNGTVPARPIIARRTPARAVWRGYVSSTTNLLSGTVQSRAAVPVPRRFPARAWYPKTPVTGAAPAPAPPAPTVPLASGLVISRRQVRAVWGGAYTPSGNTPAAAITGTVPAHLVIVRRQAARVVWRGFTSSTTNLYNGTVPPRPVIARRGSARAVWRGYTSVTTNLRNGNEPGGAVYRRTAARAVVHGNPAPFPPPNGSTPAHLVVTRRGSARAVWRGYTSTTTNLRNGNQPGGLVRRRAAARAVVRGVTVTTANQVPVVAGTIPAHLVVARRAPARATWRGFVSSTVNAQPPVSPPAARPVISRRVTARVIWRGGPVAGQQPQPGTGGLVRRRSPARGLWRGGAGSPAPVPAGSVPAGLSRVAPRRAPTRGQWRGVTARTSNALPVAVKAPRQRLTVPRRTATRVSWAGVVSSTSNAVASVSFTTAYPRTRWTAGNVTTRWQAGS